MAVGKGRVLMAPAPHELKGLVGISDTSTTSSIGFTCPSQLSSQEGSVRPWGSLPTNPPQALLRLWVALGGGQCLPMEAGEGHPHHAEG